MSLGICDSVAEAAPPDRAKQCHQVSDRVSGFRGLGFGIASASAVKHHL